MTRASTVRRLTPLADALERLAAALPAAAPVVLPLEDAKGWPLAEDLVVRSALPSVATALRDGWAVAAADTVGATSYAPAVLPSPPVAVGAGDRMPAGTDAVLPPGALAIESGMASCLETVAPGEDVRAQGADAAAGARLAPAGRCMNAALAAACVAAGLREVAVRRCAVKLAGDLDPLTRGVLASLLGRRADGDATSPIQATTWRPTPADPAGVLCEGLALSPGDATWIAVAGGRVRIHIPPGVGPAVAVALGLLLPLADRLTGSAPTSAVIRPLSRKIASRVGWSELALLDVEGEQWTPVALADVPLAALARASAWALIPPDSEGAPAGAPLAGQLFGEQA